MTFTDSLRVAEPPSVSQYFLERFNPLKSSQDYTYPAIKYKITKVQVDLSFDPAKQAEYVSALQKYWSPDLDFSERTLPVLHAPVFYTSPGESGSRFSTLLRSIPHRYETYEKYKLFVIVVTISEHAFNGSFHVELRDRSTPNAVINKVSFLRRSSTANCAACVQREASGSLVRSTMILDSSSIKTLLSDKGLNREDASNDKIIELFENSFEARVVAPDGTVLAESRPGLAREPSCKRLEKGVPHLAFYSASAAHPKGNPGGDVKFFDWIHHTSLLQDDWVDRRGWVVSFAVLPNHWMLLTEAKLDLFHNTIRCRNLYVVGLTTVVDE